jgi:hypothetical protein
MQIVRKYSRPSCLFLNHPSPALRSVADWQTNCNISGVHQHKVLMFKIAQNTTKGFTLAEILLMAAMNDIEAKRRASSTVNNSKRTSSAWAMIVSKTQKSGAQGRSLDRRFVVHSASGHLALNRKHGALIIFQHRKHMSTFFQASYKLIAPLVDEKYR